MRKISIILILLYSVSFYGCSEETITIIKKSKKGDDTIQVDKNTEKLHFYKEYTTDVIGLEKLTKLNKVTFMMTAFMKNYDFLADNPNIEVLSFDNCTIEDLGFIANLPSLRILVINSCKLPNVDLDLSNNKNLEFLRMNNIRIIGEKERISKLPKLGNLGIFLKYLDLSFNEISFIDEDFIEKTKDVDVIFLAGNKIKEISENENRYGNINLDFDEEKLPVQYHSTVIWQN